jgi:hypothetical protein
MRATLPVMILAVMLVTPERVAAAPGNPPAPKLPYALDWIRADSDNPGATVEEVPAVAPSNLNLEPDQRAERVMAAVSSNVEPEQRLIGLVTIAAEDSSGARWAGLAGGAVPVHAWNAVPARH